MSKEPTGNKDEAGQAEADEQAPAAALTGDPCFDAVNLLYYYLDHELTETHRVTITAHIESCHGCLKTYEFHTELKTVVRRRSVTRVPEELRQRIAREIGI